MEARHNYVRKVAEHAVQHFISDDKVNVQGIVLAGSADFKTELNLSDMFDGRLVAKVISVVDVSYGGENGFNQAIELAADSLSNVKFVQEKKLIQKYFDEIALDTGKYVFGIDDTLKGLEMGAVETLIVWENLEVTRYVLRNAANGASPPLSSLAPLARQLTRNERLPVRRGDHYPRHARAGQGGPLQVHGQVDRARDGERAGAPVAARVVRREVQGFRSPARVRHEPKSGGFAVRQGIRRNRWNASVRTPPPPPSCPTSFGCETNTWSVLSTTGTRSTSLASTDSTRATRTNSTTLTIRPTATFEGGAVSCPRRGGGGPSGTSVATRKGEVKRSARIAPGQALTTLLSLASLMWP